MQHRKIPILHAPQNAVRTPQPNPSVWLCVTNPMTLTEPEPDLPPASASSDMIKWSRVLLSHTLNAARSYRVLVVQGAGITEWPFIRGRFLARTGFPARR